jgi:hypothetical protein
VQLPLGTKLYLRVNWKGVQLGQEDEIGGVPRGPE